MPKHVVRHLIHGLVRGHASSPHCSAHHQGAAYDDSRLHTAAGPVRIGAGAPGEKKESGTAAGTPKRTALLKICLTLVFAEWRHVAAGLDKVIQGIVAPLGGQ